MNRVDQLRRLRTESFDVLVIGGGITGAAAARDAASRGLRTALVEARDFGEGTSSRSSRLVHGGLRYLEQLEFDLVFEASRERGTLLRIAPHLVRPLEFLFPLYREGRVGRRTMTAGMWLYDALSLFRNIERHQMLSAKDVLWREPTLAPDGLLGGARYFDAQVDDARLVLATVRSACEMGAAVANRVAVATLLSEDGRARGASVRQTSPLGRSVRPGGAEGDAEAGAEWDVRAEVVVNATGPWSDETAALCGVSRRRLLRPTRGTHIHVRRDRIGHERALIFESPLDGRIMFVLPWGDLSLIGTTDEDFDGPPEAVRPTGADVRYLLDSTNRLFPGAMLAGADVITAWAGLRPLVAGDSDQDEDAVSREHVIREELPGLLTVAGGKLTSHRAMGEEVIDRAVEYLIEAGREGPRDSGTAGSPLPGGDVGEADGSAEALEHRARPLGIDRAACERIARAHGTLADGVIELAELRPELRGRLVPDRPYIGAEVVYAVREEMGRHVEDIAFRRTHVAFETSDFGTAVGRIAALMRAEEGWDESREGAEVERARAVRSRNELFRAELDREVAR
ncbi:MAG: glycerol-3-phosphate dehydrogenase/oxidase [Gemmatimonadota bacterium]|nr:MAG: glycerol-3-phosphate dehydrogenase/oxidase [Gemmatimonadota bacterium]